MAAKRAVDPERGRAIDRAYYERHRAERLAAVKARYDPTKDRERKLRREFRLRAVVAATGATFTAAEWRAMVASYGGRCAYCGVAPPQLTRDHVIPINAGGLHTAANIVPACRSCNSRKRTRLDWPSPIRPEDLAQPAA
jgi:5-methylcytosine-specific restriction endonuclease McrA